MNAIAQLQLNWRTLIIGNSGSGKSVLGATLSNLFGIPVLDLDQVHWKPGNRTVKRNEETARDFVRKEAQKPRWIVEGVYGWLAAVAAPRALALIWLDIPWDLCRAQLLARQAERGDEDAAFVALMEWAEGYWTRQTPSSFDGHLQLYEAFPRAKVRLHSRGAVDEFVASLTAS